MPISLAALGRKRTASQSASTIPAIDFLGLPDDAFCYICDYLTTSCKRRLRLVCRDARRAVDSTVQYLTVTQVAVTHGTVGPSADPLDSLPFFPNLTSIKLVPWRENVSAQDLAPLLTILPRLRHLREFTIALPRHRTSSGGSGGSTSRGGGGGFRPSTERRPYQQLPAARVLETDDTSLGVLGHGVATIPEAAAPVAAAAAAAAVGRRLVSIPAENQRIAMPPMQAGAVGTTAGSVAGTTAAGSVIAMRSNIVSGHPWDVVSCGGGGDGSERSDAVDQALKAAVSIAARLSAAVDDAWLAAAEDAAAAGHRRTNSAAAGGLGAHHGALAAHPLPPNLPPIELFLMHTLPELMLRVSPLALVRRAAEHVAPRRLPHQLPRRSPPTLFAAAAASSTCCLSADAMAALLQALQAVHAVQGGHDDVAVWDAAAAAQSAGGVGPSGTCSSLCFGNIGHCRSMTGGAEGVHSACKKACSSCFQENCVRTVTCAATIGLLEAATAEDTKYRPAAGGNRQSDLTSALSGGLVLLPINGLPVPRHDTEKAAATAATAAAFIFGDAAAAAEVLSKPQPPAPSSPVWRAGGPDGSGGAGGRLPSAVLSVVAAAARAGYGSSTPLAPSPAGAMPPNDTDVSLPLIDPASERGPLGAPVRDGRDTGSPCTAGVTETTAPPPAPPATAAVAGGVWRYSQEGLSVSESSRAALAGAELETILNASCSAPPQGADHPSVRIHIHDEADVRAAAEVNNTAMRTGVMAPALAASGPPAYWEWQQEKWSEGSLVPMSPPGSPACVLTAAATASPASSSSYPAHSPSMPHKARGDFLAPGLAPVGATSYDTTVDSVGSCQDGRGWLDAGHCGATGRGVECGADGARQATAGGARGGEDGGGCGGSGGSREHDPDGDGSRNGGDSAGEYCHIDGQDGGCGQESGALDGCRDVNGHVPAPSVPPLGRYWSSPPRLARQRLASAAATAASSAAAAAATVSDPDPDPDRHPSSATATTSYDANHPVTQTPLPRSGGHTPHTTSNLQYYTSCTTPHRYSCHGCSCEAARCGDTTRQLTTSTNLAAALTPDSFRPPIDLIIESVCLLPGGRFCHEALRPLLPYLFPKTESPTATSSTTSSTTTTAAISTPSSSTTTTTAPIPLVTGGWWRTLAATPHHVGGFGSPTELSCNILAGLLVQQQPYPHRHPHHHTHSQLQPHPQPRYHQQAVADEEGMQSNAATCTASAHQHPKPLLRLALGCHSPRGWRIAVRADLSGLMALVMPLWGGGPWRLRRLQLQLDP